MFGKYKGFIVIPTKAGISCCAYFMFCQEALKQVLGDG